MYQLRIYTLATPEAAEQYFNIHWKRHINSLQKFQITAKFVFCEAEALTQTRVFALMSYPDGVNVEQQNKAYMSSPEFQADMEGFDFQNILNVEEITLSESPEITELLHI